MLRGSSARFALRSFQQTLDDDLSLSRRSGATMQSQFFPTLASGLIRRRDARGATVATKDRLKRGRAMKSLVLKRSIVIGGLHIMGVALDAALQASQRR